MPSPQGEALCDHLFEDFFDTLSGRLMKSAAVIFIDCYSWFISSISSPHSSTRRNFIS